MLLDLTELDALEKITEGGNDFGVDALDLSDVVEGEFTVTLFQCKYKHENLDGAANFPEAGITKAVQAVRTLFNPHAPIDLNPRLQARVEEVRSLIADGFIPRVRFLLCNNGLVWTDSAQAIIDRERFPDRVRFDHVNHDLLIQVLQSTQPVKDTLQFSGKVVVEDFNFSRIFLGKMAVTEVARLMDNHGDRLLERNIRRYLGMKGNRVNEGIRLTLKTVEARSNFFFYNNGITLICTQFAYNALQNENHKVQVDGLQIINGGQACKTIQSTLAEMAKFGEDPKNLDSAFVLVRLYQVNDEARGLVQEITYATNSQNPVDLRDLRSNDSVQKALESSIRELGFEYRRQRIETATKPTDITTGAAAEALLSVWRRRPQQAKFMSGEHFGKLYDTIFTKDFNGAQTITAVLLFRFSENKRKRPPEGAPEHVRYSSCFAAMLMGEYLLQDLKISVVELDHRCFEQARSMIEKNSEKYFKRASSAISKALRKLYGKQTISPQRLSATFRRGDLMAYLEPTDTK